MVTLRLQGRITDAGKLEVDLPEGLPAGQVTLILELGSEDEDRNVPIWSDEELEEALRVEPMAGAEIVAAGLTGGWESLGIADSEEWVRELRRKRRERRG
jgi:hypothetical protein